MPRPEKNMVHGQTNDPVIAGQHVGSERSTDVFSIVRISRLPIRDADAAENTGAFAANRLDKSGLPQPHGGLFGQGLADIFLFSLPACGRFIVQVYLVLRQLEMLDGEAFLDNQDVIAEVSHLFAQLGVNGQFMTAWLVLQINSQQLHISRCALGGRIGKQGDRTP